MEEILERGVRRSYRWRAEESVARRRAWGVKAWIRAGGSGRELPCLVISSHQSIHLVYARRNVRALRWERVLG